MTSPRDPAGRIARLRTFAVLHQRGADVRWEQRLYPEARHGTYSVTITVDDVLFWRTFNELHPSS